MDPQTLSWEQPYRGARSPVFAGNLVAASQPLAAQAGLIALQEGGNAVDAALATAIALTVVEPTSNGIGGDAFALVWDGGELHAYNGSGRAPAAWNPARFAGCEGMPQSGWESVTVPGAVRAWVDLSERFGRLPFAQLFQPAVRYALDGFLVSPITAIAWARAADRFWESESFGAAFLPGGRAPVAGERFRCPDLADSLRRIAESRGDDLYSGGLAERIVAAGRSDGAALEAADLAGHQGEWVRPLALDYHGVQAHVPPPNGQGLATLVALGILRHLDPQRMPLDSDGAVHLQVEAMRIALDLLHRHVADPETMSLEAAALLDDTLLSELAGRIDPECASPALSVPPQRGGTVTLSTADAGGMMVSFIQSNYMGFGSGVVVPGTGIALQNRGAGFSLDAGHPNLVAGGKRPFHTLVPCILSREGKPFMSFGVMGGPMQPQGLLQMILRVVDYGQNPQAAADAPRWQLLDEGILALETGFDPATAEALADRGHRVQVGQSPRHFGGAQAVLRLNNGYCGASDPRKDGQAVGF